MEMPSFDAMQERLKELEIKVAFQDDLIATLDHCVIELRAEIATLRRQVEDMGRQLHHDGRDDGDDDPPPHY